MMKQLWSFEWSLPSVDASGNRAWRAKAKAWKTDTGAAAAARKWKTDMAAEDCPVVCRLVELVPDGKGGRTPRVVWSD